MVCAVYTAKMFIYDPKKKVLIWTTFAYSLNVAIDTSFNCAKIETLWQSPRTTKQILNPNLNSKLNIQHW